jgi:hypothetical protein
MDIETLSDETTAVQLAATMVMSGEGDWVVVLPKGIEIPGSYDDGDENAIAAIDLVRAVVAYYEDAEE